MVAAGCSPALKTSVVTTIRSTETSRVLNIGPGSGDHHGSGVADSFLKALTEGKTAVAAQMLSSEFKKLWFPPFYDDEQKVGFSDSEAAKWLEGIVNGATGFKVDRAVGSPIGMTVARQGRLTGTGETRFTLWTSPGPTDAMQVVRFRSTTAIASLPQEPLSAGQAWAMETAVSFLDAFVGGEPRFASEDLSDGMKRRLPSPSIHDPGKEYAEKDVRAWIQELRKGLTGYSISKVGHEEKKGDSLRIDGLLTGPQRRSAFSIGLVRAGPTSAWKVETFQIDDQKSSGI